MARSGKCIKRGSMRICRDKKGQFARLLTGGIKHKAPKVPKKYNCKTKPRKIRGRCRCTAKTGAKPFVPAKYCKR